MYPLIKKYKTKENLIILSILIVFSIIWFYLFLDFSTMWGQDSYWYVRLAENMISGKGYTLEGINPHAQYPPGLSLLIIPFLFLFQSSSIGGLIMVFILSLSSILLAYIIGKEISNLVGICSAIFLAFHNIFLFSSMSVLTETPFMFFSILGLYLFMKSYENRNLIIPSIICITFSILIRYDGLFLIIPMIFYMFYRKKDFDDFFFSKKTFIAIGVGILILGSWLLRNWIVFGSPLFNAHSSGDGSLGLSFSTFVQFSSLFFRTGYIFPILAFAGIFFLFKEKKSLELKTFLVWVIVYIIFHSWWWHRAIRFYGQILIILCIFAALSIKKIYKSFPKRKQNLARVVLIFIFILVIVEQLLIFSFGIIPGGVSVKIFNQYDPIKQASEYANQNLPEDAVYVFPEYVVYTGFLEKENSLDYNSGLNYLFSTNGTIYLFTDNLHPWITDPFIPKDGKIFLNVPTQQGTTAQVLLNPIEVKSFEKILGDKVTSSTIYKIEGFQIIG
jgi:4-amino-4-deoxy-L-arabinose transferase-like glycosyltransferase